MKGDVLCYCNLARQVELISLRVLEFSEGQQKRSGFGVEERCRERAQGREEGKLDLKRQELTSFLSLQTAFLNNS